MFTYKYLLVLVAFITISSHVQGAVIPQGTVEARDITKRLSNVDSNALMSREPAPAPENRLFSRNHSAEDVAKGLAACAEIAAKMKKGKTPSAEELREAKKVFPINELIKEIKKHDKDLSDAAIQQVVGSNGSN